MICAIHQPQFIPWLGYFDKIAKADVFVLLDNVQFKKNEYQNRNRILTPQGPHWLTVPVSFHFGDTINQVRIPPDLTWRTKMVRTVEQFYGKCPAFATYFPAFEKLVLETGWASLADLNIACVQWLAGCLDIRTPLHIGSQLAPAREDPTLRLVDLCRQLGADTYLSGAGGADYLRQEEFAAAGIRLEFQHYTHPLYPQGKPGAEFVPYLSVLDMLFRGTARLPG